ncbi:unknown protein [Seminavis robusta]|uniref:Uncharacterized protein n=1 Tax=Seminavis robusta TaxID=568900 RepID=A0A9N8EJT4_9STRA|nr:unknown protein [Seminavis robusta]|eukprot:Sro1219_g253440.1 n/a (187) ;mRNA; f:23484-24137
MIPKTTFPSLFVIALFFSLLTTVVEGLDVNILPVDRTTVTLIFGGQAVQGFRRMRDILRIGFRDGYTMILVIGNPAVQALQAIPPPAPALIAAARRTHDINWGRIVNYVTGNPNVANFLPNVNERNFMLTVALILTEGIPGIVNIRGLRGEDNFDANVILAIMYYYRQKGWPVLPEAFVQNVYAQI